MEVEKANKMVAVLGKLAVETKCALLDSEFLTEPFPQTDVKSKSAHGHFLLRGHRVTRRQLPSFLLLSEPETEVLKSLITQRRIKTETWLLWQARYDCPPRFVRNHQLRQPLNCSSERAPNHASSHSKWPATDPIFVCRTFTSFWVSQNRTMRSPDNPL